MKDVNPVVVVIALLTAIIAMITKTIELVSAVKKHQSQKHVPVTQTIASTTDKKPSTRRPMTWWMFLTYFLVMYVSFFILLYLASVSSQSPVTRDYIAFVVLMAAAFVGSVVHLRHAPDSFE